MNVKWEHVGPGDIEKRSFEIIGNELEAPLDPRYASIVKRVIHTTADFSFAEAMAFSEGVVEKALAALRGGASIVTDTTMAMAGINKRRLAGYGGQVHCFIGDADVAEAARANGTTRSAAAMDKAARLGGNIIYALGNAPTALGRVCEQIARGEVAPALVIGVPVGFVNVVESKELLIATPVPYIVARGRKGGSNVAAAICNALLYLINEGEGA